MVGLKQRDKDKLEFIEKYMENVKDADEMELLSDIFLIVLGIIHI